MLLLLCLLLGLVCSKQLPNVVFVVSDDLGWNDVSFHGSEIQTPFIDSLAKGGVQLANYYGHSICTPSRSAIMTGRYAFHTGLQHSYIEYGEDVGLPLKFKTFGNHMQEVGYETHAVGKWHLGMKSWDYTPTKRGFHSFYGYLGGGEDYYTHKSGGYLDFRDNEAPELSQNGNYSTYVFGQQALDVINNHDNHKPLFLYLAFQAVHDPIEAPQEYVNRYSWITNKKRRTMAGMTTCMDDELKKIVEALKAKQMWDNTLFIFTADNGGPPYVANSNWPMRGGKWTMWEGGTHLTGFVHGVDIPNNQTYHGLMHQCDWIPTVFGGLNRTLNDSTIPALDGINLWSALTNVSGFNHHHQAYADLPLLASSQETMQRSTVVLNVDPVLNDPQGWAGYAGIRVGKWKLTLGYPGVPNGWCWPNQVNTTQIDTTHHDLVLDEQKITCHYNLSVPNDNRGPFLWNLEADPIEKHDIAAANPNIVKMLKSELEKYIQSAVTPLNGTPKEREKDPRSNPKNFGDVWTPWLSDEL